jgi:hypothetical protein
MPGPRDPRARARSDAIWSVSAAMLVMPCRIPTRRAAGSRASTSARSVAPVRAVGRPREVDVVACRGERDGWALPWARGARAVQIE